MGLFNFWKRQKPNELKPLRTAKVSIRERLKPAKKVYTATVALTYEGKPLRQFKTTVKAFSRENAAFKIEEQLKLKLISVVKNRKDDSGQHTN